MRKLYCQPRFARGTGLGNRLFSWAQCRLFARQHGATMISPLWFRPAFGQLLRGGVDYRSYLSQIALVGLFRARKGDLGMLSGRFKTLGCRYLSEQDWDADLFSQPQFQGRSLVVGFDNPKFNFGEMAGLHDYLHGELRQIARPRLLEFVDSFGSVPIGINIRCGNDFKAAPTGTDYSWVGWLQKTPLSWFVETLQLIRERAGWAVPAVVVSDGTPESLREILALENVTFLRPGNAITDLLVLSKSQVLLASASSTFSAWACYFGQMPTVTAPGHPMTEWGIENFKGQYIGDFNPGNPEEEFLSQIGVIFDVKRKSE